MVDTLMKKSADVNLGNRDGISPLHIAAEKSHLDVLEMLVKIGAQVDKIFRWLKSLFTNSAVKNTVLVQSLNILFLAKVA